MNAGRRRAALRVGGVVISASMLLLVERCARQQPTAETPPAAAPSRPGAAPPPASLRSAASADPPRAIPPPHVGASNLPSSSRVFDSSFAGLVARKGPDRLQRLLAANDLPSSPAEVRSAEAADGSAKHTLAPAPPPSLQAVVGARAPGEPLFGLARDAQPDPQGTPAGLGVPPAALPPATANDNDRIAAAPPDAPRTAAQADSTASRGSAFHADSPVSADGPLPPLASGASPAAQPAAAPASAASLIPSPTPAGPEAEPVAVPEPASGASVGPAESAPRVGSSGQPAAMEMPTLRSSVPAPPGEVLRVEGTGKPTPPLTGFSDDDELILEIATAHRELNGTIVAYSQRGIPFLPLGEITRFLDLAVTVSDGGRFATGWALDPSKTVTLNLREGTLRVGGVTRPLAPGDAVAFDGELYLRADRFSDLFPLTLATNLRAQTVTVQTRVPFPFEERIARETAREQLKGRQSRRDGRSFARVVTPWRALDLPLVDSELRLASDSTRGTRSEADLHLAGDLAWLTARSFLGIDSQRGLTSARLELGRRDPDGGLLGPLGATAFGIGDVTSTPLPLGPASVAGRGFMLGNASLERVSVFDRIDLRGDLPAGYEAELYRNDVLIDTATMAENGQYRFLNVPVEFGLNLFRIVLYGPQGQRRETVRQISVGDGRLGSGEFVYTGGAVQKNRSLFDLQGRDYVPGPDDGALRAAAQVQYGFTGGLTGTLGGAVYDRLGMRRWLATGGLRTGFAGFAVKLDLGLADRSARAFGFGLARKLGGFSVTLNHTEYGGGFIDEIRSFSDQPLRRTSELAINGSLRIGGGESPLRIPTNGLARDVVFADGRRVLSAALNQTVPLGHSLQLSHLVEFNRTSQPLFGTTTQLRGAFDLASLARGSTQVRATLGYALRPRAEISTAAVQVDQKIGERTTVSATAGHAFAAGQDRIGLSALRRFDRFTLAVDGAYSTRPGQYAAMLRLSFSLGRSPLDGRLFMAPPGFSSGGAIALHAFRDLDGDGRLSPGEPALANVRFFAGSENRATDAAGNVLLGKLGDGPRTSVRIDTDSLPDINLAPATEGVELVPRAGRILAQSFAVRALGELDGTAYFRTASGEKGVSGAIVLLVDRLGKTAARTRTGSDGAFWFEKVLPGDYELRLDGGQAERLNVRLAEPVRVTIRADGEGPRAVLHLVGNEPAGAP